MNIEDFIRTKTYSALIRCLEQNQEQRREGIHVTDLVFPCVPAWQDIMTADGIKPAEKIQVGDRVLTHRGRYRKVKRIFRRLYKGPLIGIKRWGVSREVTWLTPEHPILCARKSDHTLNWVFAKDIDKSTFRPAYPRFCESENVESFTLSVPSSRKSKFGKRLWTFFIPATIPLMRIAGYYLAEGSLNKSNGTVKFSFGKSETEKQYAEQVVKDAIQLGFTARIYFDYYGWRVDISSRPLVQFLEQHFGSKAYGKYIDAKIKALPPYKLHYLFSAYMNGDGYARRMKTGKKYEAGSVSKRLIHDLRDIATKLGFAASVFTDHRDGLHTIQGRQVNQRPVFLLYCAKPSKFSRIKADSRYIYGSIDKIADMQYDGFVFDFEVEEDRSYCTPSLTLHNCPRRAYFARKYADEPRLDWHSILRIWRGLKLHETRIFEEEEIELEWNGIIGRVDAYENGLVVDKKVTASPPVRWSTQERRKIVTPRPHEVLQLEYYRVLLEHSGRPVKYGAILYFDQEKPDIYIGVVDVLRRPLSEIEDEMIMKKNRLEPFLTLDKLPPRDLSWPWLCVGYCPYFYQCFREEE